MDGKWWHMNRSGHELEQDLPEEGGSNGVTLLPQPPLSGRYETTGTRSAEIGVKGEHCQWRAGLIRYKLSSTNYNSLEVLPLHLQLFSLYVWSLEEHLKIQHGEQELNLLTKGGLMLPEDGQVFFLPKLSAHTHSMQLLLL
jgi:hypothetical protein